MQIFNRIFLKTWTSIITFSPQQRWDNTHFLENLSGFETKCSMIYETGINKHNFTYAEQTAATHGMQITGLYGKARNFESTPNALLEILGNMKEVGIGQNW